ncbi:SMI1/KNR4 family protein [Nonomuraea sp. NPDC052265]|uniref:SMI1/KNR4 family protein n=1 Tax=Nonomuraea sp. NPDC052265 TaxID=3364374 RepID=UPI0037C7A94C
MATIADLENLIGAPRRPAPDNDWTAIEAELGLRLPSDYKRLMARYGSLNLDAFLGLYIANPGDRPGESMREAVLGILHDLGPHEDEELEVVDDQGKVLEVRYFQHYPSPGGLFPWGSTQNGDVCLWETKGDPNAWKACISDGTFMWRHSDGILDFLVKANQGSLSCPLLPNGGKLDRTYTFM